MIRPRLLTGLVAGATAVVAAAAPARPVTLPEVEVIENPARTAPSSGLAPITAAGSGAATALRFDADGRSAHFGDALGPVPGVWTASAQGGELAKISIRGSGIQSDETLGVQVILDGLPYNQGDGETNLEELDPAAIASGVVHRGVHAFAQTGFVLGGALELTARTGANSPGWGAAAETGAFGYRRAHLRYGLQLPARDLFASLSARSLEGFRTHSAEDVVTLHANAGWRPRADWEHRSYVSVADWTRELAGTLTAGEARADPRQATAEAVAGDFRVETRAWRVAHQFRTTRPGGGLAAGVFFHRRDFLLVDEYEDDYRLGVTDAYSHNLGARWVWEGRFEAARIAHRIEAGVFGVHETEVSENFRNARGRADRSVRTAAGRTQGLNLPLFVQDRITLSEQLDLDVGLQYVRITRRFEDRFTGDAAGDSSARQTFDALNPKLGFVHEARENLVWFGNVSRSFQPPSFDDLNPFAEGENGSVVYQLLSEQWGWTAELGQRGQHGRLNWEATVYRSELRNELLELNDADGRDRGTVNAARTRHQGLELGLALHPAESRDQAGGWYVSGTYTWNDFRFVDDPVYGRNRIAGVPTHLLTARVGRRWRGLEVTGWVESSLTRYFADQANTLEVDRYASVGLRLAWHGTGGWSLFAEVRNLTDEAYTAMVEPMADARVGGDDARIFSPAPGRAFAVGFRWQGR